MVDMVSKYNLDTVLLQIQYSLREAALLRLVKWKRYLHFFDIWSVTQVT